MADKNVKAKCRDKSNPYEVYTAGSFVWNVLKHYQGPQAEGRNPHARVFCFVTSDFCPAGEYGDTYCADIPGYVS